MSASLAQMDSKAKKERREVSEREVRGYVAARALKRFSLIEVLV